MKRTILRNALAVFGVALLGFGAQRALAADHCFYKGTMYSDGAAACQTGAQYRCEDGDWKALGVACRDAAPAPAQPLAEACHFGGVTYASGSASCQGGMQYMCDDGAWTGLGTSCPLADSPIRVIPEGRTCMFEDATVAHNSTVCRHGTTFLCSNGEWVSVGTKCR
jgi:hypothetical protein